MAPMAYAYRLRIAWGLSHCCAGIFSVFNYNCYFCATQAIGSSTLLMYYARITSRALQLPAHQRSHVNIHQQSCQNMHDGVAANDNDFCFHFNDKLLYKR